MPKRLDELVDGDMALGAVPQREVSGLQYDSRRVCPGDVFFAFPGQQVDGHQFVRQAFEAGAAAIVSEREPPAGLEEEIWVRVRHGRQALALAALRFYERPDHQVALTGVTGTNGKTTTVYLIDSILETAGFTTARLGTIEHKIGNRRMKAINTTPESLDLVRYLDDLRQEGGTHATMEVSSHALELGRIFGFDFHTAVFTNLSRDHLDFHGTMENYARAKRRLFEGAGGQAPRFSVINQDDPMGKELLKSSPSECLSYGFKEAAVSATKIEVRLDGLRFRAKTPRGSVNISSRLRGEFNVPNILAALATALSYDVDLDVIQKAIAACGPVPGRFETIDEGQPFVVAVDYAHTDDALKNLIQAARGLLSRAGRPGRVITMFGCGGDRDRTKRPAMGEIAARLSELVILTSDNPRSEDPLNIINDILVGLRRVDRPFQTEPDRARAIHKALTEAKKGDIVLLAGKGHETYQTIGTRTIPFDDREVAREVLRELGYGKAGPARNV